MYSHRIGGACWGAGLSMLLFLTGCATHMPLPVRTVPSAEESMMHWEQVLHQYVSESGEINFSGLKAQPDSLAAYVRWLAAYGPKRHPEHFATSTDKISFYINAYNGLAMYSALTLHAQPENLVRFFVLNKVPLDGEYLSLYSLENKVVRPLQEPRIHFALNCMVRSCPRLPREPFTPVNLETQLETATREFLNDPQHVKVDHEEKTVLFSKIMKWYKEDFLAVAPSLTAYANRYRAEAIPVDYRVRFLPYNWNRNDWKN